MDSDDSEIKAKLLIFDEQGELVPMLWGKGYQMQSFKWGSRVLCSTDEDRLDFLTKLISRYPGPFGLSYILEDNSGTPRYRQGRYYTKNHITLEQAQFFFNEFHDFLAQDGRHHLMLSCRSTNGAVVYDQHDYFFVYGQIESLVDTLQADVFVERRYELDRHGHAIQDDPAPLYKLMEFWPWYWRELEATDVTKERIGILRRIKLEVRAKWFDLSRRPPK